MNLIPNQVNIQTGDKYIDLALNFGAGELQTVIINKVLYESAIKVGLYTIVETPITTTAGVSIVKTVITSNLMNVISSIIVPIVGWLYLAYQLFTQYEALNAGIEKGKEVRDTLMWTYRRIKRLITTIDLNSRIPIEFDEQIRYTDTLLDTALTELEPTKEKRVFFSGSFNTLIALDGILNWLNTQNLITNTVNENNDLKEYITIASLKSYIIDSKIIEQDKIRLTESSLHDSGWFISYLAELQKLQEALQIYTFENIDNDVDYLKTVLKDLLDYAQTDYAQQLNTLTKTPIEQIVNAVPFYEVKESCTALKGKDLLYIQSFLNALELQKIPIENFAIPIFNNVWVKNYLDLVEKKYTDSDLISDEWVKAKNFINNFSSYCFEFVEYKNNLSLLENKKSRVEKLSNDIILEKNKYFKLKENDARNFYSVVELSKKMLPDMWRQAQNYYNAGLSNPSIMSLYYNITNQMYNMTWSIYNDMNIVIILNERIDNISYIPFARIYFREEFQNYTAFADNQLKIEFNVIITLLRNEISNIFKSFNLTYEFIYFSANANAILNNIKTINDLYIKEQNFLSSFELSLRAFNESFGKLNSVFAPFYIQQLAKENQQSANDFIFLLNKIKNLVNSSMASLRVIPPFIYDSRAVNLYLLYSEGLASAGLFNLYYTLEQVAIDFLTGVQNTDFYITMQRNAVVLPMNIIENETTLTIVMEHISETMSGEQIYNKIVEGLPKTNEIQITPTTNNSALLVKTALIVLPILL